MTADLDTLLSFLSLPTRLENYAERHGLRTVRDLVALPPATLLLERNMGRKTLAETEAALLEYAGATWAELRALNGVDPGREVPGAGPASRWYRLRMTGLPERMASALTRVPGLPTRMITFASAGSCSKVRELLAYEWEALVTGSGLGRRTVEGALDALEVFVQQPLVDPLLGHASWLSFMRWVLADLPSGDRLIITQRSGLSGPAPTLAELGELFGVSRERIRQRASRAIAVVRAKGDWLEFLLERMARAANEKPLMSFTELASRDSFFVVHPGAEEPFSFFVDELLAGPLRTVIAEGVRFISRLPREHVEGRLQHLRKAAEALSFPLLQAALNDALASSLGWNAVDVQTFAPLIEEEWLREGPSINGFGSSRADVVLAYLRSAGTPVPCGVIEERFGRGRIPPGVVFVDRGLITVPELVPDWDRWVGRLGPACARIIAESGPERQWTTAELVPVLIETADLPPWCNEWTLGSALRAGDHVKYLGRNTVALAAAPEERLPIFETALKILEKAGCPLDESVLLDELRARRGIGENTWAMLRLRRPVLLFEDNRIGLMFRDLPGGQAAAAAAVAAVFSRLDAGKIGLTTSELRDVLRGLGGATTDWDMRMFRTTLRHDGRFRLAHGGAVGLAEWGDTRAPTQAEVLRDMLEEQGGIVDVADAMNAIRTSSGEPLGRSRLGMLSLAANARIADGRLLRREPEPPEPGPMEAELEAMVIALPEVAAGTFRGFLLDPGTPASVGAELAEWRQWIHREAETNICIERDQVEALLEVADRLLAQCWHDGPLHSCVRAKLAAVRYLACVEDGESDAALGGLDDDEAVLRTVAEWAF